jgi:hypothetical protein
MFVFPLFKTPTEMIEYGFELRDTYQKKKNLLSRTPPDHIYLEYREEQFLKSKKRMDYFVLKMGRQYYLNRGSDLKLLDNYHYYYYYLKINLP